MLIARARVLLRCSRRAAQLVVGELGARAPGYFSAYGEGDTGRERGRGRGPICGVVGVEGRAGVCGIGGRGLKDGAAMLGGELVRRLGSNRGQDKVPQRLGL